MTLEIKEGGFYVNRKGEKRGPMVAQNCSVYRWRWAGRSWTDDGRLFDGKVNDGDLIAEWTDPAAEPEWGEWMKYADVKWAVENGVDFQMQRIDGVLRHRVRIAPPAPVVETVTAIVYTIGGDHADATVDLIDGKPDWSTLRVQP